MDADGSNLERLTFREGDDSYPSWSPDGKRILFAAERNGFWDIYVMDADASNRPIYAHYTKSIMLWTTDRCIFSDHMQFYLLLSMPEKVCRIVENYSEDPARAVNEAPLYKPAASQSGPTHLSLSLQH